AARDAAVIIDGEKVAGVGLLIMRRARGLRDIGLGAELADLADTHRVAHEGRYLGGQRRRAEQAHIIMAGMSPGERLARRERSGGEQHGGKTKQRARDTHDLKISHYGSPQSL